MRKLWIISCVLLLIFAVPTAFAQAVPDNVPDRPDYSPGDVNRERLVEAHRSELARLYAASHVAVMPFGRGVTSDQTVQGGIRVSESSAVHMTFGVRSTHAGMPFFAAPPDHDFGTAYLLAFGYDISARAFLGDSRVARRSSIGFGIGTMTSEAAMLTAEINPRMTIYEHHRWSIPVGVRLTTVMLSNGSDTAVRRSFAGLSVGFKMNFVHRDRLYMK